MATLFLGLTGSPLLTLYTEQGAEFSMVGLGAMLTWYGASILVAALFAWGISKSDQKLNPRRATGVTAALLLMLFFSGVMSRFGASSSLLLAFDTVTLMAQQMNGVLFSVLSIGVLLLTMALYFHLTQRFARGTRLAAFVVSFSLLGTDLVHFGQLAFHAHSGLTSPIAQESNSPIQNKVNVIHLVLDEMSGESLLNDPVLSSQAFFRQFPTGIYFADAHSNALSTHASMRQVLSGNPDPEIMGANPAPLLRRFKEAGYSVNLFLNDPALSCSILPEATCFDQNWAAKEILFKGDAKKMFFYQLKTLAKLYRYRLSLRKTHLMAEDQVDEPIGTSIPLALFDQAIRRIASAEGPAYHLIHLLLPHAPFIHDEQCRVVGDPTALVHEPDQYQLSAESGYERQLPCANRVAVRLLEELQRMKLYDDSFIIIQSDHGSRFRDPHSKDVCSPETKQFVSKASHMVLWLKPPHAKELVLEKRKVQALDVPVTLARYFGMSADGMTGRNLLDQRLEQANSIPVFGRPECVWP